MKRTPDRRASVRALPNRGRPESDRKNNGLPKPPETPARPRVEANGWLVAVIDDLIRFARIHGMALTERGLETSRALAASEIDARET